MKMLVLLTKIVGDYYFTQFIYFKIKLLLKSSLLFRIYSYFLYLGVYNEYPVFEGVSNQKQPRIVRIGEYL